jgi:hypothetical protein
MRITIEKQNLIYDFRLFTAMSYIANKVNELPKGLNELRSHKGTLGCYWEFMPTVNDIVLMNDAWASVGENVTEHYVKNSDGHYPMNSTIQ